MSIKGTTAIFVSLSALSLAAVLAGACAINPQPLPPDTSDGSFGGQDAGGSFGQTGDAVDGAAATPSASDDGGVNGGGGKDADGGDAGDRSTDGGLDDGSVTDGSMDGAG